MTPSDIDMLQPVRNLARDRFEIPLGNRFAFIDYRIHGNTITMYHTEVPHEFRGQGVAAVLTKYALDWAQENGYRVNPMCSYIARYIERHPEYQANTITPL